MKKRHHIYRRRRVGAVLFAAVVFGTLYAGAPASAGRSPEQHIVAPGETLWSIAVGYYPSSEDPREMIEGIRQANGLGGYGIQPGEHLELPPLDT